MKEIFTVNEAVAIKTYYTMMFDGEDYVWKKASMKRLDRQMKVSGGNGIKFDQGKEFEKSIMYEGKASGEWENTLKQFMERI